MNEERLTYSFLKEIEKRNTKISAAHYGLDEVEFQRFVMNLQKEGFIRNFHLAHGQLDFTKVEILYAGMKYLADHFEWIMEYRDALDLKLWIARDV